MSCENGYRLDKKDHLVMEQQENEKKNYSDFHANEMDRKCTNHIFVRKTTTTTHNNIVLCSLHSIQIENRLNFVHDQKLNCGLLINIILATKERRERKN